MGKNEKDIKMRLMRSAIKLFAHKGLNNVSLDDILTDSKVKKGSYYYYYNTKDDLLNDSLEALFTPIMNKRFEILEHSTLSFRETMDKFYRNMHSETEMLLSEILGEHNITANEIGFLMMEGMRSNTFARTSFKWNQDRIKTQIETRIEIEKQAGRISKSIVSSELSSMIVTIGEGAIYLSSWNSALYSKDETLDIGFKYLWDYLDRTIGK